MSNHAAMPKITSQDMASSAKCSQINNFITAVFAALDVVNMTLIKWNGNVTVDTFSIITLPHSLTGFAPY